VILLQELPYQRGLVSRKIVEDDVDLLLIGTQSDDFLQEDNEILTGVPCGGFAMNAAGSRVQRCIQGERSVPLVFESVAFGATGRKRQDRIEPIQSLNRRLLIDTEHSGMMGRIQVQPDDVGSLGFEIRIIAGHVALQPVRLQSGLSPDAMHGIFALCPPDMSSAPG
jgi:hypothetical protein